MWISAVGRIVDLAQRWRSTVNCQLSLKYIYCIDLEYTAQLDLYYKLHIFTSSLMFQHFKSTIHAVFTSVMSSI